MYCKYCFLFFKSKVTPMVMVTAMATADTAMALVLFPPMVTATVATAMVLVHFPPMAMVLQALMETVMALTPMVEFLPTVMEVTQLQQQLQLPLTVTVVTPMEPRMETAPTQMGQSTAMELAMAMATQMEPPMEMVTQTELLMALGDTLTGPQMVMAPRMAMEL